MLTSSDCKEVADSLRGKKVVTPFVMLNDCAVAYGVEHANYVGKEVDGDDIADAIEEGLNTCKDPKDYISTVSYFPGSLETWTLWFGTFCGPFSSGIGNCGDGTPV